MGRIYPHVTELVQELARDARISVEIGCGSGQYRLCVPGRYLGIDRAEYYSGGRADLRADARWLPLFAGSVDFVFMVAVLCEMVGGDQVLAECGRVLRPGGTLAIFDYSWWKARTRRTNWHTSSSLARRLEDHGFIPRIHWFCTPAWSRGAIRRASRTGVLRLLTYLVGNWVVVSGTKVG